MKIKNSPILKKLLGIGVTMFAIFFSSILNIPNPMLICLTGVVYSTFIGGYFSGIISSFLSIIYAYFFFSTPGQLLHYTTDNVQKLITIQIVIPFFVFLVGHLKRNVDRQIKEVEEGKNQLKAEYEERLCLEKEHAKMSRLDLIGQMAAEIGHEIRNPMQTIRGFMQFLQENDESCSCKIYYPLLISELDRANSIISEFLSLASNKRVDLKEQNMNDIVSHLFPLLTTDTKLASCQVELELNCIPNTYVDEGEIHQLILNLIRNSIDACSKSDVITIKTYKNEDHHVVLSISDTGSGIPEDIISQIGVPFFSTKDHGTGLGLAICYSIANRHNAEMTIKSSTNGTTVEIIFLNRSTSNTKSSV